MSAIQLDAVSKEYPGGVRALDEVSVEVGEGESVAIVGPSGSGKTTVLTIMGTLERPSAGHVRVAGCELDVVSDARLAALRAFRVGFVFQTFHLQESLSALENVASGLLYTGAPARRRREAACDSLARVGLANRISHRPSQLSGGERQRVAIARAIVKRPLVLLADEPTGNLDSTAGGEVIALLHELAADGATLVLITHDQQVAASFPRRLHMHDGHIVADERS
jgi:putative ABC transport system ATP-binding protein